MGSAVILGDYSDIFVTPEAKKWGPDLRCATALRTGLNQKWRGPGWQRLLWGVFGFVWAPLTRVNPKP